MSESVYIEISILGHLTARPTDNLILAANIKVTQDWWNEHRHSFTLYASEIVADEAAKGDRAILGLGEESAIAKTRRELKARSQVKINL